MKFVYGNLNTNGLNEVSNLVIISSEIAQPKTRTTSFKPKHVYVFVTVPFYFGSSLGLCYPNLRFEIYSIKVTYTHFWFGSSISFHYHLRKNKLLFLPSVKFVLDKREKIEK